MVKGPDFPPEKKTREKETPFDPHSVQSVISLEEQRRNREMRGHLARIGLISPELVQPPDVDIVTDMQAEMNALNEPFPVIQNPETSIDVEQAPEVLSGGEKMTAGESRSLLGKLIDGYKQTLEGASERFTKSKNYLNGRAKEMDSKPAEMGDLEKWFRTQGERYDKLSLIHKLGIGVTLGVGTAVGSAVSLPLALVGLSGLVIQRAAGAASMFLKIEKDLQEKKVGENSTQFIGRKERAMLDTMLYTVVMGYAIKEGLELAKEYNVVERTREWLGNMRGHHTPIREVVGKISTPTAPVASDIPQPAAAAAAGEVVSAAGAVKIDMPTVEAVKGQGSEYMMKRLWEDPTFKNLDLSKFDQDSNVRKLFAATPETIDKVVHNLAIENEFYKGDGTSTRVGLGSTLTIDDSSGKLKLTPDTASVTPAQTPEARATIAKAPVASAIGATFSQDSIQTSGPFETPDSRAGVPIPSAEVEVTPKAQPTQIEAITAQPVQTVDLTPEQEAAPQVQETSTPPSSPTPSAAVEAPTAYESVIAREPVPTVDVTQAQDLASQAIQPNVETPVPETSLNFKVNAHGLSIDAAQAGSYLDTQGNHIIFGGSLEERVQKATELVAKDHSAVVYFDSTRPSGLFGLFQTPHLSKAYWFEGSGGTIDMANPAASVDVKVQQPIIVDDTIDPTLRGRNLPSIDDLKEIYKPIAKVP